MKKTFFFAALAVAALSFTACQKKAEAPQAEATEVVENATQDELGAFLTENEGKYPADVNLLENPSFKSRVEALVGEARYADLSKLTTVTPIEKAQDDSLLLTVSFAEQHNVPANNVKVCYNVETGKIAVENTVNEKTETLSE